MAFRRLTEQLRQSVTHDLPDERATPAPAWSVAGLVADVAVVIAFAALGRRNHDETGGTAGTLATAAPFLVGVAAGWLVVGLVARRRHGRFGTWLDVDGGVDIWIVTVVVGLLARRVLWDRGIALSFVIVTAIVLGVGLVGWRALAGAVSGRRAVAR